MSEQIATGTKVEYFGSLVEARGEGDYFGPCVCHDCMYGYVNGRPVTRHHLITPAGSITHVRRGSFTPL